MSKLEALMLEQIQLQTPAAADKAKGINYINKAILDKNIPGKKPKL
jgi:hypothetical protein